MSSRWDLWVFDLDGVLVDTSPCHARAYADLWGLLGIEGPAYETLAGRTTRDVVNELTRSLAPTEQQVEEWVRFKQERARVHIGTSARIFDDTEAALESLARKNLALALGTSASRANALLSLDRFDLARFFTVIVTGNDVENGKPAPDIYVKAIEDCGLSADRALVVEDSVSGVSSGLDAGAWVAVVRSRATATHRRFVGRFEDIRALVDSRS